MNAESGLIFYASIAAFTTTFVFAGGRNTLPATDRTSLLIVALMFGLLWPISMGYYAATNLTGK